MKRKFTLITAALALLTILAVPIGMWGQTRDLKTETFETATASTTYNSTTTVSESSSSCGIGWTIYYGSVSTTQPITGSQSCLMRYYTASSSNLGYAATTTGIQGLTNVTFNAKVTNTGNKMGVWYSTDQTNWTAIATEVTLTTSSQSKSYDIPNSSSSNTYYIKIGITSATTNKKDLIIDDVAFTYSTGGTPTAATPTFSPAAGFYASAQNVTISTTTDGATIYYTTDGTDPTTSSSVYSSPISVSANTTIKAMATATGYDNSSIATATYVISEHAGTSADPYSVADARAAIDANSGVNDVYVAGIVCTGGSNLNNGALNYWISDDGTETDKLEAYKGKGINGASFTSTDDIKVGDVVVIIGNLTKYNSTYEFAEGSQLVSLVHKVATPTFSPAAGAVVSGTEVTISSATDGATIYYTTNGDTPTASSTQYTGAITVNEAMTIKAIGVKSGYNNSIVAEAAYTITLPTVATPTFSPAAGEVASGTEVTISSATNGATIYYTTNGDDPTTTSTLYEGAITVSADMTIKAIGVKSGYNNSAVATADYTIITPATLPFNWAGGTSNSLLAQDGVTAYGLGSDYTNSSHDPYYVKFDNDGDYIQILTDSRPGEVSIGVKMIGGSSTSKIKVQGSTNGSTFDDGEELTISGSQNAIVNLKSTRTFDSEVRYVRLYFVKGSNVGVGPISITKYVEKYAVTLADVTGGTITRDKVTAAEGETVTLTATPATHYTFTSWSVYKTGEPGTPVTVTNNQFTMPAYPVTVSATFTAEPVYTITKPDNVSVDATSHYAGETVTITVTPPTGQLLLGLTVTGNTSSSTIALTPDVNSAVSEYTFTMPAENVTIAATFGSNYTVQFSVNGTIDGTLEATVTAGESTTLPTSTSVSLPTGYTLAGWTADESSTATILTGSYTPAANVTLYAVFAGSETTKTFSFTISTSDFNTTSYAANNNEKTSVATATSGETISVNWTSNQVMLSGGVMQWKKDEGYIYNSTNLGTITNVEITSTAGTFTTYYGTSEQPSSGEAGSDKGFFKTSVGDATGKTSSMVITFQKSITPYCTRVYNKTISKYNNANDGWHLIASPVASLIGNTNMLSNEYDLYLFDQNEDLEWVNYKAHTSTFTTLEPGKGYLYANSAETTLTFAGVPNDLNGVVTLSKIDGKEFSGYNLIGNPYNVSATLDKDFYKMNSAGSEISVEVASGGTVDAMEGVFVVAASDGETVTFTPTTPVTSPAPSNQLVMNLSYNTRGSAIDRAIVRFGEGNQLPKFQLFENSTKVYIPQGGKDYAIVRSEAQGELPINFKAEKNGSYTLSFEAENVEMDYLHLIDNLTGADIDLLQTPSYTFNGKTTDYASRFRLVFSANNVNDNQEGNTNFAYINGEEIVILNAEANATLQVVDLTGRIVSSTNVAHSVSTAGMVPGVYVLRLINGTDVKVQKIVIK